MKGQYAGPQLAAELPAAAAETASIDWYSTSMAQLQCIAEVEIFLSVSHIAQLMMVSLSHVLCVHAHVTVITTHYSTTPANCAALHPQPSTSWKQHMEFKSSLQAPAGLRTLGAHRVFCYGAALCSTD